MPGSDLCEVEVEAGVALVRLNRPERLNALSRALRSAIAQTFDALEADPDVRVVVLTGAGRGFCAGLDLKEMVDPANGGRDADPVAAIERCSKPVIGAINGVAVTGGFELALACDILLASTSARFADTHARVGILPGWRLSQKLSRIIGPSRAKELSFSGNYLDAADACAWGLVNRVLLPDELLCAARRLATEIASAPLEHVRRYKQLIDLGYAMPYAAGVALEAVVASLTGEQTRRADIRDNVARVFARGRDQAEGAR